MCGRALMELRGSVIPRCHLIDITAKQSASRSSAPTVAAVNAVARNSVGRLYKGRPRAAVQKQWMGHSEVYSSYVCRNEQY
jgi:hypothetical protein